MRQPLRLATLLLVVLVVPMEALAQKASSSNGGPVPATYATKAEAEKAAKLFHCTGAHQMGDRWMPCQAHGNAHSH
ncbi:MAG: hypothetical protein VKK99_06580 [Cyanobacteriota bacterium]|nr:hypothetical protein [Cyanobacteriota bacterium]